MTVLSNPQGRARTFFASFPKAQSAPPYVLTGLLMGTDHEWISQLPSDYHRCQALLNELRDIYGPNDDPWKPEEYLVNRGTPGSFEPNFYRQSWSVDDPLTGGGNSYISVEVNSPEEIRFARESLKSPLESLPVFWAGEATAPAYHRSYQPLCVHGAYISGIEVAKDLDRFLGGNGDEPDFGRYYQEKYRWLIAAAAPAAVMEAAESAAPSTAKALRPQEKPLEFEITRAEKALLESYREALKLETIDGAAQYLLTEILDARLELTKPPQIRGAGKEIAQPTAPRKVARVTVYLKPEQINHLTIEAHRVTGRNNAKAAVLFLAQLARRLHLEKRRTARSTTESGPKPASVRKASRRSTTDKASKIRRRKKSKKSR
jgi:hypothetical protein